LLDNNLARIHWNLLVVCKFTKPKDLLAVLSDHQECSLICAFCQFRAISIR